LPQNAEHWRERAAEARAVAATLNDPIARAQMLAVAAGYDRMAIRAEERADDAAPPAKKN